MDNRGHLYLWAVIPPDALSLEIDGLRQEFAANFNAVKALKPPVHITLYQPFTLSSPITPKQLDVMKRTLQTKDPFIVALKDFDFFERVKSPVIYINVVKNEGLKQVNTAVLSFTKKILDEEDISKHIFHPHITIGYRDVSPEIFPEVKAAYRNRKFAAQFPVSEVILFRHNGSKWMIEQRLPLRTKDAAQSTLF